MAILAAVLWALASAGSAQACSCSPQAPGEALRSADAAVVAELVEVTPHGRLQADYHYELVRVYRGRSRLQPGGTLVVRSARRSAACALPRQIGHRYGLFLTSARGHWFGGICGAIKPRRLWQAAQDGASDSARTSVQQVLCGQ